MITQPANIAARRLRKQESDKPFFDLHAEWLKAYPRRWREVDALEGHSLSPWESADDPYSIHLGVWKDGVPTAICTYHQTASGWFEGYLDAARGTRAEDVAGVIWSVGWDLFEQFDAYALYMWIHDPNRASRRLAEMLHLRFDGTVRWLGLYHGKILRSRRWTLYRSRWLEWQNVK